MIYKSLQYQQMHSSTIMYYAYAYAEFIVNFTELYNFRQAQYMLPDDDRRPKQVGAIFMWIIV
jgi:hypothetical protein